MFIKPSEKGQALILITLAAIGLFGFAALAIDGGRVFSDKRHAQNAADTAALAAALAKIRGQDYAAAAQTRAATNGYDNGDTNDVAVHNPPISGTYIGNNEYIQVIITSYVPTTFARVIGRQLVTNAVEAVVRAKPVQQLGGGNAIFAGSQACQNSVDWSGSDVNVIGGVASNKDIKVGGSANHIEGNVSYVTTIDGASDKVTFDPPPPANPVQTSPQNYPVAFNINDYAPGGSKAAAAQAAGKYYTCNCKMDKGWMESQGLYNDSTKKLKDGLYYTTGDIDLSASEIIGNAVTFVAKGDISLSGSAHRLAPYVDGLLIFTTAQGSNQCNTAVVKMSGSAHDWSGIIYAPNGLIEMSGSANSTMHGTLIGNTVKVNGSAIAIQYDPDLFPPDPPKIQIMQ